MAEKQQTIEIRAQEGAQETFLASSADIAIYGGAAGGGKTWALLLECLRWIALATFGAVVFRRTTRQIRNQGGLWDKAGEIYPLLGGESKETTLEYEFPSGARIRFAHLQHESNVYDWQGSELPLLCFDELTHFTEKQFFYLLSRNRSMCGVAPYVRATCNPDADSWVASFIAWWIDQETGLPIPERSGVIRYFLRVNEVIEWGDTREELVERHREYIEQAIKLSGGTLKTEDMIKSATFIAATIHDNKKLLAADPAYLANLLAQPLVERERLLGGNWKIRATAGKLYNRDWFEITECAQLEDGGIETRYFDFASTEKETAKDDPDYTASVAVRYVGGECVVTDCTAEQLSPAGVEKEFERIIGEDLARLKGTKTRYRLRWEIEPGSAAKRESYQMAKRILAKFGAIDAKGITERKDKIERAKAAAVLAEQGLMKVLRNSQWNERFLRHLHNQPEEPHDDIRDAWAGATNCTTAKGGDVSHGQSIYG